MLQVVGALKALATAQLHQQEVQQEQQQQQQQQMEMIFSLTVS